VIWVKNHLALIGGILAALAFAVMGMQKASAKQAARASDLTASNAPDAALANGSREQAVAAVQKANEAQQTADRHHEAAKIAVKSALDTSGASGVGDDDLLAYLNRQ